MALIGAVAGTLALAIAPAASLAGEGGGDHGDHHGDHHGGGHHFAALTCGAQVTESVTLTADIGPCPPTSDGLDIVASGIRLDLNGHSITGTNASNATTSQSVGINLMNVHGVTVTGPGTIQHFDAGVAVNGGSHNKITRLTAQDNVAHVLLTGGVDQTNPEATPCDYGDGVVATNSNHNRISDVVTTRNGPFDGIGLVEASNGNKVVRSNSYDNNIPNIITGGANVGTPGPCGPFGANTVGQGRPHQDIGIRIEGPGATHNIVSGNASTGNELEGISIHGNVCPNNPAGDPAGAPNTDNLVKRNLVERNGFADQTDGIAVLSQGPPHIVCVAYRNSIVGNYSNYNARDGIFMGGRGSTDNLIRNNSTDNNGKDGIELSGPGAGLPGTINSVIRNNEGHGNALYDGKDGNPGCDNNLWKNNRFLTFDPPCVMGR